MPPFPLSIVQFFLPFFLPPLFMPFPFPRATAGARAERRPAGIIGTNGGNSDRTDGFLFTNNDDGAPRSKRVL
jgi:hypothetical protein